MTHPEQPARDHILIVDDTPNNVHLLVRTLSRHGYEVQSALSGEQALKLAQETRPDLILLDIVMPVMDGFEVCERLKADDRTRDIPVIFISALHELDDKVSAFNAGGVDYITKPLKVREVLARVQTHVALRKTQRALQSANELLAQRLLELAHANDQLSHEIAERKKIERENQRLLDAERQRVRELSALRTTMTEISAELDAQRLLHAILERAVSLLNASSGALCLYDEQRNELEVTVSFRQERDPVGMRLRLGEGLFGMVAFTRRPWIVDSYAGWDGHPPHGIGAEIQTVLAVPLLAGRNLVGAIGVGASDTQRQFDPADIQLLEMFAQQATIAIQNARLFDQARVRAEEAETLREACAAVTATLKQHEAIQRILEQLALVVPYDSAAVLLSMNWYTGRALHALSQEPAEQMHDLIMVGGHGFTDQAATAGLRVPLNGEHPARIVYTQGQPYFLDDAPATYPLLAREPYQGTRSWMGVPLIYQKQVIGLITLSSHAVAHFTKHHGQLVSAFATQVAITLAHTLLFDETQRLAITDPLTGLYNRRHFFAETRKEYERFQRSGHPLSVVLLDVDLFKSVNDTHGHPIGDLVLQAIADRCRETLRMIDLVSRYGNGQSPDQLLPADVVGRYGGEEFAILLPETDLAKACRAGERLRLQIAQTPIEADDTKIFVTVSLGIACTTRENHMSVEELMKYADAALYEAKETGRNRVAIWNGEQAVVVSQ